jgi:3-oxoacyl-[acyl-carrier-protein] synthase-3
LSLSLPTLTFYFPTKKLTNESLSIDFEVSEEKILKNTGIKSRYVSEEGELASDMACKALEEFFNLNTLKKKEVDFLIFCSECFDFIAPATSCIIQDRVGLPKTIGCFDLPYGCSGYIYGLALAKSLIVANIAKNVLFVTADTPTKTIDKKQLELMSLFSEENVIGEFVFGTDGSGYKDLYSENSAFRISETLESTENKSNGKMIMNGINIFNFSLRVVPKLVNDILTKNKCTFESIDLFVFHQPSLFLLETLAKKMNINKEKFYINIENHGNTVSSSIPLALSDAYKEGKIKEGMTVLIAGFGVGLSWGGTIIKF